MEQPFHISYSAGSQGLDMRFIALFTGVSTAYIFMCIAGTIFLCIAMRKVLEKAWLPWRWQFIPIYNVYLFFKMSGYSTNWTRWILFPPVLWILTIVAQFWVAKKFWKPTEFWIGLRLLPIVFYPILAFGKAKYHTKD